MEQSGLQRHEEVDPLPLGTSFDAAIDPAADLALPEPPRVAPGALQVAGALHIEQVDASALPGCETAWADLVAHAIEPNVFLEPAFALPLFQHVALPVRPSFLLVWEENGPASFGRLVGLFPLSLPVIP